MACTLFRLTPEEALRGVTANAARALGLADRGTLARRPARRLRRLGRRPPASSRTGSAATRARASSVGGDRARAPIDDRLREFHAASRHDAAPRQHAARRHRDPRRAAQRCRAARPRRRGHRLAPRRLYAFARELGAEPAACRASRATSIDLNRPPEDAPMYPGANNTGLCPTRFFTGDALYRDGREPDDAEDRAPARALVAAVPRRARRRARAPRRPARPRRLSTAHSIKSELPWLFEGRLPDLNLGTDDGASCAPSLARRARDGARGAVELQPRRRRPLQGRLHHAPLRPSGRRRARGPARDGAGAATCARHAAVRGRCGRTATLRPTLRALIKTMRDWKPDAGR